nr:hypothetical protein Iba_chr10dCG2670 [Ipomoea batatas]
MAYKSSDSFLDFFFLLKGLVGGFIADICLAHLSYALVDFRSPIPIPASRISLKRCESNFGSEQSIEQKSLLMLPLYFVYRSSRSFFSESEPL